MNFMDRLHRVINNEKKLTENGARGYAATGSALVDLNFAAASLRNRTAAEIVRGFIPAFYEDRVPAGCKGRPGGAEKFSYYHPLSGGKRAGTDKRSDRFDGGVRTIRRFVVFV